MDVVITVEQENALRAIGGLPPLQEPLQEQRLQEPLQEPLQERTFTRTFTRAFTRTFSRTFTRAFTRTFTKCFTRTFTRIFGNGTRFGRTPTLSFRIEQSATGLHGCRPSPRWRRRRGHSWNRQAFYCPFRITRWPVWKLGRVPNRRGPGRHAGQLHACWFKRPELYKTRRAELYKAPGRYARGNARR